MSLSYVAAIYMFQDDVVHTHSRCRIVLGVVPILPLLLLLMLLLVCHELVGSCRTVPQENWISICWEHRMAQMQVSSTLNSRWTIPYWQCCKGYAAQSAYQDTEQSKYNSDDIHFASGPIGRIQWFQAVFYSIWTDPTIHESKWTLWLTKTAI